MLPILLKKVAQRDHFFVSGCTGKRDSRREDRIFGEVNMSERHTTKSGDREPSRCSGKGPIRGLLLLLALVLSTACEASAQVPLVLTDTAMFRPPAVPVLQPVNEEVLTLAFSPDGKRLVTAGSWGGKPGQLKVWDLAAAKELVSLRGIRGTRAVAFSPDGETIACGEFGGAIRLRDAATGKERAVLTGHTMGVNGLAFSRDGTSLASAGLDHTVKVWNVKDQREQQVLLGHADMVLTVAYFRDRKALVTGGRDMTARIWYLETGKEKCILKGHRQGVETVAVSPDDKIVATASWDQTIRLWNAETGKEIGSLTGAGGAIYSVAFSPQGDVIAGGTGNGTVHLWDVKTRKLIGKQGRHAGTVWTVAFSPDGKTLASGSSDKTAKVWSVGAMKSSAFASLINWVIPAATLDTSETRPIRAMASSPDGKVIAVATDEKKIRLRDALTGETLLLLPQNDSKASCLAFSPDGQIIAAGSSDSTIRFWDRATGKPQRCWKAHGGGVNALVFTPDGKELASAGEDQMIRLWNIVTGKERILAGHTAAVHALAMRPTAEPWPAAGVTEALACGT